VIPRLWVCAERTALLDVLALPLHPLILLGMVTLWGMLKLSGRSGVAAPLYEGIRLLGLTLVALTLGFVALGALLGVLSNPSGLLALAPWAWAIAGPTTVLIAAKRARTRLRAVKEEKKPAAREAGALVAFVTLSAAVTALAIAARHFISDADGELSAFYRLFEWAVVDELGPVTDECLANRVLEYAQEDAIGGDALSELAHRGPSAAPGVRARLADLNDHWPPPANTIKAGGIDDLLMTLVQAGDATTAREWEARDWRANFPHRKHESRAIPLSH
jgi:hypothetical protein